MDVFSVPENFYLIFWSNDRFIVIDRNRDQCNQLMTIKIGIPAKGREAVRDNDLN